MEKDEALMLLMRAAEAEIGIAVRTNNVQLLRNKLYAAKRGETGLPELAIISPPVDADSVLWIVKKER
jgi:hypothetical protein